MKILLFIIILITGIFLNSFGQIEESITKKHLLVGGSFGFNMNNFTITNEDGSTSQGKTKIFNSDLYCGYFILNQVAIGIKSDLEYQWYLKLNNYEDKTFTFILNSFLRYYFKFGLFGEGTIGIGTSSFEINSTQRNKREIFTWSLGVGYSLFVTDRIAIEPILSYKGRKEIELLEEKKDIVNSKGLYFRIGFQIYLKTSNN